nr:kinesin-like protein KIF16B isoform X1 [Hydra vulgaris]
MASIKVAVRVRPFNQREKSMDAKCIIHMESNRTCIISSKDLNTSENEEVGKDNVKEFFFDYCYWSCDKNSSNYSGQDVVYSDLGTGVVTAADEGYNACIFAYGQTGSGKTHTMMGEPENEGLIPRICENLFNQMHEKEDDGVSFRTEVSYLEIYNEKVRDLLRTHQATKVGQPLHPMKVREHPKDGPYVQGLTKHLVSDYHAIETIMKQGNERRTTASTNMNDTSSRSHAIFTIRYTQAKFLHDMPSETTSKINLVDLAGSERANSTGATGLRLKEGGNINKSLVTLGSVISSLAEASTNPKKSNLFIPYRDSVLTWLLKDSLGGNSKTIMIAAISPADINYSETLSTLRYANRAKNIINKPTVNEDTNVKLIRDLRAEIDKLKSIIGQEVLSDADRIAARKLYENEERLGALTDKWKDRWKETQKIMQDRALAFQHRIDAGIRMESELPHLIAHEDDLLSTGILLYHLKEGKTFVGTENSKTQPDIVVSGPDIQGEQCIIENNDGFVVLDPFPTAICSVNGEIVSKRTRLQQGDVVTLGKTAIFRFNHPKEAEELREKRKSVGPGLSSLSVKYHSETDLLKKMINVERQKREEDLTKQLDESRMLLEKQKQEEERRMEEARNEFARQIREESRRLQETRGELQGRLRARLQNALTPEEIRKHLAELEHQHNDAEVKRKQREKELVDSINEKISLIDEQQNCLNDLVEKCKTVKDKNKQSIEQEIKNFFQLRRTETSALDIEINKFINTKSLDCTKITELKEVWNGESLKLFHQENICDILKNEIKECIFALDQKATLSNEDKISLEARKSQLLSKACIEQAKLEEVFHSKAKALKKYEQNFLNRYQFLLWEKEAINDKSLQKKNMLDNEIAILKEAMSEAQSQLDEISTKFFEVEAQENEKIASERYKVDQIKKISMKQRIEDQRDFNEKVQQYRNLLRKGQDSIDVKNAEIDLIRKELNAILLTKNEHSKSKAESLQGNLNSMIEDLDELKKNYLILKNEEEKIITNMLGELNNKKAQIENNIKMAERVLNELQNLSSEKINALKKQVNCAENNVFHCEENIAKCNQNLNEINKWYDEANAQLDTELLYVAYLVEKELQGKEEFQDVLSSINVAKLKLEQITKNYSESIENFKKDYEVVSKPLTEAKDQAQVVLEDLLCARNVAEMTLNELREQFSVERKIELEEIYSLKEKLQGLSEKFVSPENYKARDNNLNSSIVSNESDFNISEILDKQKQQIEDEMFEKIINMESVMQQELTELKQREMHLLACLQSDKEKLLLEKFSLEKKEDSSERFLEVARLLKIKDDELKVARDIATREIEKLHNELANANNEIIILQERLEKYDSNSSLLSPDYEDDDLSDTEVSQLLIRVNKSEGFDDEDELIARLRNSPPSPPPTPIHRFLKSVNIYKMNQINGCIPRYILRGIGKGSYHVFEVKLRIGNISWTVYRRYRQFRELHRQTLRNHPIIGNLEFPSRRYFGNLAEDFVRVRRTQLEAYLIAFLAILSNDPTCRIYAISHRSLTKQDLAIFHPFFKEGIYERNKND